MITSIYNLRDYGFIHSGTTDQTVIYVKHNEAKWEIIELLNEDYTIKRNGVEKFRSVDFKEIVKYLNDKKII